MRPSFALTLLLLLYLPLGAQEPTATPTSQRRFLLCFQTPDRFVSVFSHGTLEPERAEKLAADVRAAYAFVRQAQGWRNQEVLDQPLLVGVETAEMNVGGMAQRNAILISLSSMNDDNYHNTLGHELTHCQDGRQLGKDHYIPHYFLEGRAIVMGRAYDAKLGRGPDSRDRNQKKWLLRYTWHDAEDVLKEWQGQTEPLGGPYLSRLESIGAFFVEFLRTRYPDQGQPRSAKVIEDVGAGVAYAEAFHKEYGVALEEAMKAFKEHMWDTQSHPEERFKGTMWAEI